MKTSLLHIKSRSIDVLLLPLLTLLLPSSVRAAVSIDSIPFTPWPLFPNLGTLISTLLWNAYTIAGILLFVLLFAGGFMVIMGGIGGDSKKTEQGQQAVTGAVFGFVVIFTSYWILQIIKVITGVDILKPGI